uniref:Ribonuclease H-like domain-containing protein n=1 Tax=Tanacetum cinerariifolium TaxID=118510 RepID=A0A699H2X2_TANCI|nr:ribonuclease H-like domain-containing protein [Tanacetum cinerariifolium]
MNPNSNGENEYVSEDDNESDIWFMKKTLELHEMMEQEEIDDVVKNDDVNKNGDSSKKIIIGYSFDLNMSFGDSLYLHLNDTGGSPIVTIKLTSTENYKMGSNYNLKCTNCNKNRHTVDKCFELVGYPAGYVKRNFNSKPVSSNNTFVDVHSNNDSISTTSNSPASISDEQLARLMNLLNDNRVSNDNANMAHKFFMNIKGTFFNGSVKFNLNFKRFFNGNTNFVIGSISLGWIVDSGANQHMTGNDDTEATSMDEKNSTHLEGTIPNETDFVNNFYENLKFNSDVEELLVNTVRRSSRQTKLPTSLNNFVIKSKVKYRVEKVVNYANLNHENFCFASGLNKSIELACYEEAILDNNWINAMNAKIKALNKNHTWEITELPANRKAIGNKWIFKIKYKASGDIDRNEARLVVKGFNKKEGIGFDETFSHVVKMSTIRCVIALSVTNNWPLFQLDVNNAFLYGDLDEEIYMTIPQGFANKDN